LAGLGLLLLIAGFGVYVGVSVARDLLAARRVLRGPIGSLSSSEIQLAKARLTDTQERLAEFPAAVLRLIPVARQNLFAVDSVVDSGIPVLDAALQVRNAVSSLEDADLVSGGTVRIEAIRELEEPLARQARALAALEADLSLNRSGWLLPPLWDAVNELLNQTKELQDTAENGADGVALARVMLGSEERRTYLVVLMNNSELRGAGGILSGVGTLSAKNGRISLGPFNSHQELSDEEPYREVPAPPDFERRFGRYRANKTVWVNTTASPDVPEVATVAMRLYELSAGVSTDGAVIIDPRGIASLMSPGTTVMVPGTQTEVTRENLPEYVYSDSYEELGGPNPERRRKVLVLGASAFRAILERSFGGEEILNSAGEALSGRHLSFFSSEPSEQEVLEDLEVAGELTPESSDSLMVTLQNLGADKLDFWVGRRLAHSCSISEKSASCKSRVTLLNQAPRGLPAYVALAQEKESYALYEGYIEIYVPAAAQVMSIELNSQPITVFAEEENDRKSLGAYVEIERGDRAVMEVEYELPITAGVYSLQIDPQPLANDARIDVRLNAPDDWLLTGPDKRDVAGEFSGTLDRTLEFEAEASGGQTGLAALWEGIVRFWRDPVF
jgi:hypothetical protein